MAGRLAAILFVSWSLTALAAPTAPRETVRIGGTGGALGTMRLLADTFEKLNPSIRIVVLPSLGSSGGVKAVMAGDIEMAVSVRPASDDEQRRGCSSMPYGKTAMVFAASGKNPPFSLTMKGLAEIYEGKRDLWPDGTPLRLILRQESGSETSTLLAISPEINRAVRVSMTRKGMIVALTEQETADKLERLPGTFAPTVLSLAVSEKRRFRILPLEGVAPSVATIADGSYPPSLVRTYHAVTGPSASPAAKRFLAFLRTPAAQKILSRNGHVPVGR